MSRLVLIKSLKSPAAERHEWDVVLDGKQEQGLNPAVLLNQVGELAGALAKEAAGAAVFVTSVHKLEVLAPVLDGERLIVTAALEPSRDGAFPVSLVVRRRRGAPGAVVIAGVIRFSPEGDRLVPGDAQQLRLARGGAAPMETTFKARLKGDDLLLAGNLVPWVHASALVSAQGFAAGPVALLEIPSLSLLAPVHSDEPLTLSCSVVKASGAQVTVLTVVRSDERNRDVLCAVSTFKVRRGEVPWLVVS